MRKKIKKNCACPKRNPDEAQGASAPTPSATPRLEVRYSPAEGITLHGTTREDAHAIKRAGGWRWFRSGGFWFVPQTRGRVLPEWRIERAVRGLAEQGLAAKKVVSYEAEPAAERYAADEERVEERRERLEEKAARAEREANAQHAAARAAVAGIEPGQPILVGHHSERKHRRALERSDAAMQRSVEAAERAKGYASAARAVEGRLARYLSSPNAMRARIAKLEAENRDIERRLSSGADVNRAFLDALKANNEQEVTFLRSKLGAAVEAVKTKIGTGRALDANGAKELLRGQTGASGRLVAIRGEDARAHLVAFLRAIGLERDARSSGDVYLDPSETLRVEVARRTVRLETGGRGRWKTRATAGLIAAGHGLRLLLRGVAAGSGPTRVSSSWPAPSEAREHERARDLLAQVLAFATGKTSAPTTPSTAKKKVKAKGRSASLRRLRTARDLSRAWDSGVAARRVAREEAEEADADARERRRRAQATVTEETLKVVARAMDGGSLGGDRALHYAPGEERDFAFVELPRAIAGGPDAGARIVFSRGKGADAAGRKWVGTWMPQDYDAAKENARESAPSGSGPGGFPHLLELAQALVKIGPAEDRDAWRAIVRRFEEADARRATPPPKAEGAPARSKGHVGFAQGSEFFWRDDEVWRAPVSAPIGSDGYRTSARFESTRAAAPTLMKIHGFASAEAASDARPAKRAKAPRPPRTKTVVLPHAAHPRGRGCRLCGVEHTPRAHSSHRIEGQKEKRSLVGATVEKKNPRRSSMKSSTTNADRHATRVRNPRSPEATLELLTKATHYVGAMVRAPGRKQRRAAAEQARLYLVEVERYPAALTPSMRALVKRVKDSIKAAWKAPLNVTARNPLLGVLSANPADAAPLAPGTKLKWKDMPASIRNSPAARRAALIAARADGIPLEELEGEVVLAPPGTSGHVSCVGALESLRVQRAGRKRVVKKTRSMVVADPKSKAVVFVDRVRRRKRGA